MLKLYICPFPDPLEWCKGSKCHESLSAYMIPCQESCQSCPLCLEYSVSGPYHLYCVHE
uniref:Uncharacterized protein n=1 Tax=Arundo donax TaxID=35708 RepID=A0A0A9AAA4_ARUDO